MDEQVIKRLRNYKRTNDMLFICQKIIVSCFLEADCQTNVREAFLVINTSDSGEINAEELKIALPNLSDSEITEIISNRC